MSNTIEDLEKQVGTGTLDPEVEKFVREYIASKSAKVNPNFRKEFSFFLERLINNPPRFRFNLPEPPSQESASEEKYERLLARHNMLLSILGQKSIEQKMKEFFPDELTPCKYLVKFTTTITPTLGDYAALFSIIDRIYRFLATLVGREYFIHQWISGILPTFSKNHLLSVDSIRYCSPLEIQGGAIREIATALGDVLTVGKQIENVRLSSVHVAEAKVALERKQLELEQAKRENILQSEMQQLNCEVEKAKKLLELEKLKREINEEKIKQRQMLREEFDNRLHIISQSAKILDQLPEELRKDVESSLQLEIERLYELPFEFIEIDFIP
jgi:hypothetical protein